MSRHRINSPLLFEPIYKEKIWGGRNLQDRLHKPLPTDELIGESWELAGFDTHWSIVADGQFAGTDIRSLLEVSGTELLGAAGSSGALPLLFKFIDANDRLSVQVHPDDVQARANGWGNFGKTECWYVVDAKPSARIIVGLREGVDRGDIEIAARNGALDPLLNSIPVAPGDMLFVPAGTVHAILDSTLIYEVQESSDTTFRLYDWGRTDEGGASRPLHIAESLRVLDTGFHDRHKIPPVSLTTPSGSRRDFRVACSYFAVEEYCMGAGGQETLPPKQSFQVLTVLGPAVELKWDDGCVKLSTGSTALLPASLHDISVRAPGGTRFLLTTVPDLLSEVIEPLRRGGVADADILMLGGGSAQNHLRSLL